MSRVAQRRREQQDRCNRANALIQVIASTGRQFLRHESQVSSFHLDERGRLWLTDRYSGKVIDTHRDASRWKGFTCGGTLKALCESLRDYVLHGRRFALTGRHWAYGEAMEQVLSAARALGILAPPEEEFFLLSLNEASA